MSALNRVSQSLKNPAKSLKNPAITKKKVKHKKLDEDWFEVSEPIKDGMVFNAKYLGMTLVDEPKGDEMSALAVQRIVEMAKAANRKLRKVQLTVSLSGIRVHDSAGLNLLNDISVYRISFCASVKQHNKVFSFVAQNADNETMECHAYLCSSTKEAQSLTVTVAQSFKIAFELWEEEGVANNVEPITPGSELRPINGDDNNKRTGSASVLEKRYQRLSSGSNPFDTEPEINCEVFTDNKQSTHNGDNVDGSMSKNKPDVNDVFFSPTSQTTAIKSQMILPIRPPPARQTDKPSPRRTHPPKLSTGNIFPFLPNDIQTPSPSGPAPDTKDWDQEFADLALSRTKGKDKQETNEKEGNEEKKPAEEVSYPPSNPFSNPHNPFFG